MEYNDKLLFSIPITDYSKIYGNKISGCISSLWFVPVHIPVNADG